MSGAHEAFKINLNQNLWGSLVGFVGLGTAEYFALHTLFWFSLVLSSVMLISVIVTTSAYTKNYWDGKMNRAKQ